MKVERIEAGIIEEFRLETWTKSLQGNGFWSFWRTNPGGSIVVKAANKSRWIVTSEHLIDAIVDAIREAQGDNT